MKTCVRANCFHFSASILRTLVSIHSVTFSCVTSSASHCFSSFSSMSANSFSGLTGFMTYASAAWFRDSTAFSSEGYPVSMIFTILGKFSCNVVSSFMPSMSGSLMSNNARLKNFAFDFCMASLPSFAVSCCILFAEVLCSKLHVCLRRPPQ